MIGNIKKIITGALLLVASSVSFATVIVNTDTTTDVTNNREFLHITNVTANTATNNASGITFGGVSYRLANVAEFVDLVASVTGLSVPTWNGSNLGDFGTGSGTSSLITALLGSPASSTGDFNMLGDATRAFARVSTVHTSFADFHLNSVSGTSSDRGLFVRDTNTVPVPAPLLLMGLGLVGFGVSQRFKKV